MSSSDVFVFPSLVESFGLPMVEALQADVPIVASDRPLAREILRDAAIYIDPLDPASIASGIASVIRSRPLRESMIATGRVLRREFDYGEMAERVCEVIESVVRKVRVDFESYAYESEVVMHILAFPTNNEIAGWATSRYLLRLRCRVSGRMRRWSQLALKSDMIVSRGRT